MSKTFSEAMKARRSVYAITNASPVSDARIEEVVGDAVANVPSAFNSQSARAVVLFGDAHKKLWSITMETLRKMVPAPQFGGTEEKINSFAAGHGTVLYFDDTAVTEGLMQQFPLYAENFPVWANQANGMLQFAVWSLLEAEGLGANLQHYNPLIDDEVKSTWNLPKQWKLLGQMPFGAPSAPAGEKQFQPINERLFVFDK